jgi:ferredoxin-NADP reductase
MAFHHDLSVLDIDFLTPETYVLKVSRPETNMKSGQCFSVGTHELGINREYSIYSSQNDDFIEFLIRKVDGGVISTALSKVKVGQTVEVGGPYGEFCLDPSRLDEEHIFIASGTGIAPFRSFVRTYPTLKYRIFHGIRHEDEQYRMDEFKPNSYFPCVSRPKNGQTPQRVTDLLLKADLNPNAIYYLCGNRSMIVDSISTLREKKVQGGQIFTETFF